MRPGSEQQSRRRRTQPTARADIGDSLETVGEIPRRRTVQAAIRQYGETELDPLRDSKPVEFA
jgi:hypothetical protein